jgi:hypothetical protein
MATTWGCYRCTARNATSMDACRECDAPRKPTTKLNEDLADLEHYRCKGTQLTDHLFCTAVGALLIQTALEEMECAVMFPAEMMPVTYPFVQKHIEVDELDAICAEGPGSKRSNPRYLKPERDNALQPDRLMFIQQVPQDSQRLSSDRDADGHTIAALLSKRDDETLLHAYDPLDPNLERDLAKELVVVALAAGLRESDIRAAGGVKQGKAECMLRCLAHAVELIGTHGEAKKKLHPEAAKATQTRDSLVNFLRRALEYQHRPLQEPPADTAGNAAAGERIDVAPPPAAEGVVTEESLSNPTPG